MHAQYKLGTMYAHGIGCEKNPIEAYRWLKKAANQGHLISKAFIEKAEQEVEQERV